MNVRLPKEVYELWSKLYKGGICRDCMSEYIGAYYGGYQELGLELIFWG